MEYFSSSLSCKKNQFRISNYKNIKHNLNFNNIVFPVRIKDIPTFEKTNSISINVFGYDIVRDNVTFYALYNSKDNFSKVIDLLYIESDIVDSNYKKEGHFALIKDFNKLINGSLGARPEAVVCKKCMNHFTSQEVSDKHNYFCIHTQPKCEMPNHGDNIKFKNNYRKFRFPIAIAADFEALLVPDGDKIRHIPSSAAFVVNCEQVESFQLYRG